MPTALITGANRGIGLALTRGFATDGWRVHACCRQPRRAQELLALDGEVRVHRLDVTNVLQVENLGRELVGEGIDLLVNNAGIQGPDDLDRQSDYDAWLKVLKVNALAPLRMIQCFAAHVARSDRKVIVNISSRMGSIAGRACGGSHVYRSSKSALNSLVKGLSIELKGQGIVVVSLHPGWTGLEQGDVAAEPSAELCAEGLRRVIGGLSLERSGCFLDCDGREIPW